MILEDILRLPYAQQLRALVALAEDLSSEPTCQLTTIYNSAPGDLTPSYDLCGHQVHTWCTDIHAGKLLRHITWLLLLCALRTPRNFVIDGGPPWHHLLLPCPG